VIFEPQQEIISPQKKQEQTKGSILPKIGD